MNCFPCFKSYYQRENERMHDVHVGAQQGVGKTISPQHAVLIPWGSPPEAKVNSYRKDVAISVDTSDIDANQFSFRELATATKNFREECLIGECGYGRIYKGTLQPSGKVVTVKRLDKHRAHGNKEFLVELVKLSQLRHPNLLDLVGYCADGDQRILVYEYMPMGSVKEHLLDMDEKKKSLDWATRLKIVCGIAKGIEYLHDKANPAVIYRDLKCKNIMLDEDFNPKLSDHGLAKLGCHNTKSQVIVMGNFGYCAPEYEKHGDLTVKSDVYNFGVVLLELITGRGAVDTSKDADEQNLVKWAQPIFKDPRRYPEMADPRLNNSFPVRSLNQVVGVAAMCLQDEPDVRPLIGDVVAALTSLTDVSLDVLLDVPIPITIPQAPSKKHTRDASPRYQSDYSEGSSEWSDYSDEESDNEIHYIHKHAHMEAEIGHHKNQNDQKDTGIDEESDDEIQYKHNHAHMEEEIGYLKNQNDQKDTHMDEEIDYRTNQYNQNDTPLQEEIGCHENQQGPEDSHMGEEIGYRQNHYDQKGTHVGEKISYRQNQYDIKYVSTDEESDYDENQDEHRYVVMDKEIGHNKGNQCEQKVGCSRIEETYNKKQHEKNYHYMDEESGSDYDSDSSHEDIILSSRQNSQNRIARLDSKGRNDMILKDENIGSNAETSSKNM